MKSLITTLAAVCMCCFASLSVVADTHKNKIDMKQTLEGWDNLSNAEKIERIEALRAERNKRKKERWDKMSDEGKIKLFEKQLERMKEKHKRKEAARGER